ncbi:DUF938 domain-containing protein [Aquisalimonas asiatica]|uniref:Methyltransferase domain-containing protein n=1 Tax=Aquisalimonas asiatica TaxID=406100 RepID=A0A1H8TLW7_9GAMM|nr:DUF938 domain-containing protein [Aquisalimonas asiatica]SEO91468.1 Protein of unknown function [Aquisalimonas asiatica]
MNADALPWSQACENNKGPILDVVRAWMPASGTVLEIGTGTGQHVVHFARALPGLHWYPTDRPGTLDTATARIRQAGSGTIALPEPLDVLAWPESITGPFDGVFSANTAHIMGWPGVEALFAGVGRVLRPGGRFLLYGPFAYGGEHTAPSNARFHATLQQQDPDSGIRDMDDLLPLAGRHGLRLVDDVAMPANNRTLVWTRE